MDTPRCTLGKNAFPQLSVTNRRRPRGRTDVGLGGARVLLKLAGLTRSPLRAHQTLVAMHVIDFAFCFLRAEEEGAGGGQLSFP